MMKGLFGLVGTLLAFLASGDVVWMDEPGVWVWMSGGCVRCD